MNKRRWGYILLVLVLVPVGLLSRRFSWIPVETGDVLWAMMAFCLFRLIFVRFDLRWMALYSLAFSFVDEFAQLITWPWLVEIRSSTLGHLVLGQGFEWQDLIAYTIGVGIAYLLARLAEG